jgi:hypothetical protein
MRNFATAICIAILMGCSTAYQPGVVAKDWSCKMRELQIQPLFPPREDVQVGDIYLLPIPKNPTDGIDCGSRTVAGMSLPSMTQGFEPISIFWGSLSVEDEVRAHYAKRLDLPKTQAGQLTLGADGKVSMSGYSTPEAQSGIVRSNKENRDSPAAFTRLRVVGFPDFMAVKVSNTDVGAILPVLGMPMELGIGADAVESAVISVPVAESYGLPAPIISEKLLGSLEKKNGECPITREKLERMFAKDFLQTHDVAMVGIYEVYYTRAISSTISLKQNAALGLNRDHSGGNTKQEEPSQTNAIVNGSSDSSTSGTAGKIDTATDLKNTVAAAAAALQKRKGLPGVTLDVSSGSSLGIGLTRVFEHPIAIGYRAVSYRVGSDPKSCVTLDQLSHGGSSGPTVTDPAAGGLGESTGSSNKNQENKGK